MYIFILLLLVSLSYAEQPNLSISLPIAGSEGLVDKFGADVIPDNASPDLQNIYVDKDIGIVSRNGYAKFYSAFNLGDYPIKQLYEYIQSNGGRYMIAICSRTAYWITDTSSGVIKSGLPDYNYWIVTWQDKLYIGNMTDTVWNWDGITVSESTSLPKCEFATTWGQRLLLGRETDNGSVLYETLNNSDVIDDITSDGYELISPDDGDTITAIRLYQGQVIVWKKYSTWKIVGTYFGNSQVYNISKEVGCLDSGSIQEHRETLKWLSHKGIMQYDGNSIGVISTPIDTTINTIVQKKSTKFTWKITSSSEWAQGVTQNLGIRDGNITTNTTLDGINQRVSSITMTYSSSNALEGNDNIQLKQSFKPTTSDRIYQIDLLLNKFTADTTGNMLVYIQRVSDSLTMTSSNVPISNLFYSASLEPKWYSINFSSEALLEVDKEYDIKMSPNTETWSTGYGVRWYKDRTLSIAYIRGDGYRTNDGGLNWISIGGGETGAVTDFIFKVYLRNSVYQFGLYSSTIKTDNWNSWGNFFIKEEESDDYKINHYIKVNDSLLAMTTTIMQPLIENEVISVSTGKYIQIISSFVYLNPVVTNGLSFGSTIQYIFVNYGTDSVYCQPCASAVYDDRYWLSVSTIGDNSNSTILVQDQRDKWIKFVGINAYSLRIFNQKLYSGSNDNTGQVYLQDTGYNDDGNPIDAYYTTKSLCLGELYKKKLFNAIWTTVKTSSGTLYIDYKIDNTTTTWKGVDGTNTATKLNLNDTSASVIFSKNSFGFLPQGRYIQFRIRNNILDEYFTLKNLSLIYGVRELDY